MSAKRLFIMEFYVSFVHNCNKAKLGQSLGHY